MIREALRNKRILLTGATGFLGSAVFERLLFDVGVARVELLVRGDPARRLEWLLAGSLFGPARSRFATDFERLLTERVGVHSINLAANQAVVVPEVDLVIHAAATVEFDSPIGEAFATNLGGSVRLCEAARGVPFLHVSTAYVADLRDAVAREEPLPRFDWRAEADAAAAVTRAVELDSRSPERLDGFLEAARSDLGKAGTRAAARRAEELRSEWMRKRLVVAGGARARAFGWPDVYTLTKGLTEIALDEVAGDRPLAIVRPSIIESALAQPFPGWIEGFRMADPVMLAYGRGALPEFAGSPDALLDVIPVDMVVNAILAVAASSMRERRSILHVASGCRNPLRIREAYEEMRRYFLAKPLPVRNRGTVRVPEWRFPGRRAVAARLDGAKRLIRAAEAVARAVPGVRLPKDVERKRRQLDLLERYATLYGPYVETEVVFDDHRAVALHDSMPEEDRKDFPFDAAGFTWTHYFQDVHLPAITGPLRWPAAERSEPRMKIARAAGAAPVLAVFDVEGTLVQTNVVETYVALRLAMTPGRLQRAKVLAETAARLPSLLAAERRDRADFLRLFYREYAGASLEELRREAAETVREVWLRKLAPAAVRRVREHRDALHMVVFVTGSLDFMVDPLRPLADEIVAVALEEKDGRFTGDITSPPLVGQARASWLRETADRRGADLSLAYAYGDSLSDLPMLEAVGSPVAVNPEPKLREIARKRRWAVEEWPAESASPPLLGLAAGLRGS